MSTYRYGEAGQVGYKPPDGPYKQRSGNHGIIGFSYISGLSAGPNHHQPYKASTAWLVYIGLAGGSGMVGGRPVGRQAGREQNANGGRGGGGVRGWACMGH